MFPVYPRAKRLVTNSNPPLAEKTRGEINLIGAAMYQSQKEQKSDKSDKTEEGKKEEGPIEGEYEEKK